MARSTGQSPLSLLVRRASRAHAVSDVSNDQSDLSSIAISVLIVDDDEAHAQAVAESLRRLNCDCTLAGSGQRAIELIESENYDVVITDLRMEGVDGLAVLNKARQELPESEVIVLTGHSSIHSAVTAMQGGAYTYLTKPLDIQELRSAVEKASSRIRLIRRNAALSRRLDEKFGFGGVVGNSPAMHKVIEQLKNLAPTETTVLILGESGTGKELVARVAWTFSTCLSTSRIAELVPIGAGARRFSSLLLR